MNLTDEQRSALHFVHLLDQEANDNARAFLVLFSSRQALRRGPLLDAVRHARHNNACIVRASGPAHATLRAYELMPHYRGTPWQPTIFTLPHGVGTTLPHTDLVVDGPTRKLLLTNIVDEERSCA